MKLSEHFDSSEFACKCGCGSQFVEPLLVSALEELRESIGKPVRILSGVRCAKRNSQVKGKKDSYHLLGMAADIVVDGELLSRLFLKVAGVPRFHLGGVGIYPDAHFIHVDIRGTKARWGQVGDAYCDFLTAWERTKELEGTV